ncbi:hypothetical protein H8E52_05025 [bacterium]|nr:hypothetical protein [bacterium]MBL6985370.1 hypothetical protein [Candidatus Thioglobus sp.]
MTPEDALIELLDRVAALQGASALISTNELAQWPGEAVTAMKAQKLITRARPASSAVCPGCEEECVMPVHTIPQPSGDPALFIVCDKRDDIGRISVPTASLEQWQASGDSIAELLAGLLGLQRPNMGISSAGRWEIGMLKGTKHSSHLALVVDSTLTLSLANHSIPLTQVLALDAHGLKLDKHALLRALDGDERQPSAGIGSPVWRKQQAKAAADARHNQPGGSRDKQQQIRDIWATGKYTSRDRCAEEECAALDMSYSAARKALRNTPDPTSSTT